jgi:hypothetical protein
MKAAACWISALLAAATAMPAHARDALLDISIDDAMSAPEAQSQLNRGIEFRFGDQAHPEPEKSFGEYSTSKRTRAFNRGDKEACEWVFLTAMLELQKRAETLGADAVVNIRSNWRHVQTSSSSTFVCARGNWMAGVALIGEFVKLK